jgi:aspartyl-tRNA(Asn)/glutamyl-tRNA(Gln) amidotransferase subunit B
VERALRFERERQAQIITGGGNVVHETRMWRESEGVTAPTRSKEETHDYGYFPEPDLPPFRVTAELLGDVRARLPEMPFVKERRFREDYGLTEYEAGVLTADLATADYFEAVASACGEPREAAHWIQGPAMRQMNARGVTIDGLGLKSEHLAGIVSLFIEGGLSRQAATQVFDRIIETGEAPPVAAAALGLEPISDPDHLERVVDEVLAARADAVSHYRAGKNAALNALVGDVMKATQGRADPAAIRKLILDRLRE